MQASTQRHGGDLAARQHVIADRHLLEPAAGDDALVDALEPPADHDRARPGRERAHARLAEGRPARAEEQLRSRVAGGRRRIESGRQHVAAQHHARPAPGRRVVDGAVPADAVVADALRLQRP